MATEIEAKFRLADPEALRARLGQLPAVRSSYVLESNHIFDMPDGRLRSTDRALRVRICRPLDAASAPPGRTAVPVQRTSVTLTFKGPRQPGELKSREELETAIADAPALLAILKRLGLSEVVVFEKRRETWTLTDCQVTLDELPELGWYVEIEGPSAAAITTVRGQLQLNSTSPVAETYVDLAAEHGDTDVSGRRSLFFGT